jgi:hypothetical protein
LHTLYFLKKLGIPNIRNNYLVTEKGYSEKVKAEGKEVEIEWREIK